MTPSCASCARSMAGTKATRFVDGLFLEINFVVILILLQYRKIGPSLIACIIQSTDIKHLYVSKGENYFTFNLLFIQTDLVEVEVGKLRTTAQVVVETAQSFLTRVSGHACKLAGDIQRIEGGTRFSTNQNGAYSRHNVSFQLAGINIIRHSVPARQN